MQNVPDICDIRVSTGGEQGSSETHVQVLSPLGVGKGSLCTRTLTG